MITIITEGSLRMEDNNISSHSTSDKRDKKRKHKKMKDSADEEQLDQAIISLAAAANSQRSDDQRARTHVDNNQQRKKQSRTSAWNFEVDYNDHFETPLRAYEDLQPVLQAICNKTSKTSEQLIVYDPYYCQGKMLEHMKSLGYSNVINRNRDFYRDITTKQIPAFDILVTNPPYSGEHKVRLLNYLRTADKPFALLLPAYIATKSYWKAFLDDGPRQALYILPPDYYHYLHPEGTGKALPPFYSAWLIGGLDAAEQQRVKDAVRTMAATRPRSSLPVVAGAPPLKPPAVRQLCVAGSLQEMVRMGVVTDSNRPNPKQRKKLLKQKQAQQGK